MNSVIARQTKSIRIGVSRRSFMQMGVVLVDQLIYSFTSFMTGVLVARGCAKEDYGNFVFSLAILRTITGIQNSVIGLPFTIIYPHVQEKRRSEYVVNTLLIQVLLAIVVGMSFFVIASFARQTSIDKSTIRYLDVLGAVSIAFISRECLRIVLFGQLRIRENLCFSALVGICILGGLSLGHLYNAMTTQFALLVIGVGAAIPTLVIGFLCTPHNISIRDRNLISDFFTNWNIGKWLTIRSLMYMTAFSLYPFYLQTMSTAEQVAAYGVCFSVSSLANPLVMGIGSYLRPKFSRIATIDQHRLVQAALWVEAALTAMAVALIILIAFEGQNIITMLYGKTYSGLQWPLVFAVASVGISIMELPFFIVTEARKDTKATFLARCSSSIFTLIGGVFLVRLYGIYGATIGMLVSHLLGFLHISFVFYRGNLHLR